jgi:hypothetical protein
LGSASDSAAKLADAGVSPDAGGSAPCPTNASFCDNFDGDLGQWTVSAFPLPPDGGGASPTIVQATQTPIFSGKYLEASVPGATAAEQASLIFFNDDDFAFGTSRLGCE